MDTPPRRPVVPLGTVVARRDLRTPEGTAVTLSVGTPVHVGDGWDWACPFRAEGLPQAIEGQAFGIDAMQALQLVTPALRRALERSGERFTWLDGDFWQAGFPTFVQELGDEELEDVLLRQLGETTTRWTQTKGALRSADPRIRAFVEEDEDQVVDLWQRCELTRPWNDPRQDIRRKLTTQPELFLVAEHDGRVVGSAMGGFDGHRGWLNYVAVAPEHRTRGIGGSLVSTLERLLVARGCPKINLQVRAGNAAAIDFYAGLGYVRDDVVSLGKRLVEDGGGA